jgi:hypothetical protein
MENIQILNKVLRLSLPSNEHITRRQRGYNSSGTLSPGQIPFSPCWFNIANRLSVSTSLRGWPNKPGIQYLCADNTSLSILGAVLSIIHPRAAERGIAIMNGIRSGSIENAATKTLGEVRSMWPCPFTAFSIISNRETEVHRDGKGFAPFYDIITTIGEYTDGRLEVPGIGLRFRYDPGTIVGLCGKVLEHGVGEVEGDRICMVQYFHRRVLDLIQQEVTLDQEFNGWMKVEDFTRLLSRQVKQNNE